MGFLYVTFFQNHFCTFTHSTTRGCPCVSMNSSGEIYFDGVRFISAARAAKEFGVVRDYISRLARQGKLRGRQFGARWYLDETAFKNYLVLREYEHAARRWQLAADRQREYRTAQAAASKNALAVSSQASASPRTAPPAAKDGLQIRLLRLSIHIRLDQAQRSN
jgi:hypothetical protein